MTDDEDRLKRNQTKWEEATRCPRCSKPGKDTGGRPGRRRGVKVHTLLCETQLCPWFNTTWLVQVNEDGSIPDAYSQVGSKQFTPISQESETRLQEALAKQLEAETRGDGEIRNPFSR